LSDGNGYRLWDLEKRQVVKSRDVQFQDFTFPYGIKLTIIPPSIQAEISWPPATCPLPAALSSASTNQSPPQRTPTPDLPLLDIQLEPRFNRQLTASIHAQPPSPCPSSVSPPSPPPPSPDVSVTSSPCPNPATPVSTTTPADVVLITLPDFPEVPVPPATSPQGSPSAPSGTASVPRPPNTVQAPPSPPRQRSGRERRAPDRYGSWAKSAKAEEDLDTPKTWRQLLKSPNKAQWLKAANNEFVSLLGMHTWTLVPRPQKRKVIKSKWVFKI
jgi:hypothetical protein